MVRVPASRGLAGKIAQRGAAPTHVLATARVSAERVTAQWAGRPQTVLSASAPMIAQATACATLPLVSASVTTATRARTAALRPRATPSTIRSPGIFFAAVVLIKGTRAGRDQLRHRVACQWRWPPPTTITHTYTHARTHTHHATRTRTRTRTSERSPCHIYSTHLRFRLRSCALCRGSARARRSRRKTSPRALSVLTTASLQMGCATVARASRAPLASSTRALWTVQGAGRAWQDHASARQASKASIAPP